MEFTFKHTYNRLAVEITVTPQGAIAEFTQNEGYSTYKIEYSDTNLMRLMTSLVSIHNDDVNYPSSKVFWKDWFYHIREDMMAFRMQSLEAF